MTPRAGTTNTDTEIAKGFIPENGTRVFAIMKNPPETALAEDG
jgi:hypothetical protein